MSILGMLAISIALAALVLLLLLIWFAVDFICLMRVWHESPESGEDE